MRYNFTAKNMVLSDSLKENTIKKINRLERLFPEDAEVYVVFSVVKLDSTIEITIPLQKRRLRAEVSNRDMYIALDEVVDILERQMVKYRKRIKEKARRDVSFKEELRL
ncbi:MAG: ribosome-associated translation inhibitor RaiA, partial [Clostridiales bacterium]|nr:ribosome-associated translation inhibitor RaiA [Clostridiales bacterium]